MFDLDAINPDGFTNVFVITLDMITQIEYGTRKSFDVLTLRKERRSQTK